MLVFNQVRFNRKPFRLSLHFSSMAKRIVIMGASGSGKSSTLSLIGGQLPLTQGQITWEGQPCTNQCAILFQKNNLFPHLTLLKNVGLALRRNIRLSTQDKDKALDALHTMGIDHLASRYPHEVSGGEQQRAALARILLMDKPILLLDEPFNGLGPGLSEQIMDHISYLEERRHMCTILTTHSPHEASYFGEEIVFIKEGKIVEKGSWDQLRASKNPHVRHYFGQSFAFAS